MEKGMNNAGKDYLTGLYDREWLYHSYDAAAAGEHYHLFYLDLDNFKSVNDLYGHEEGDRILRYVAGCLRSCVEDGYPVRMGGDEFVLIIRGRRDRNELNSIFRQLVRQISMGVKEIPGLSLISVSAGAADNDDGRIDLQEVLRMGDHAMYEAKRAGKRRCVFYDDIQEKIIREQKIAEDAPEAVAADRFTLVFNPLTNPQNNILLLTQVVALWNTADGEVLEPDEYRPILENNGYIRTLDLYLLNKFFKLLRENDYSRGKEKKHRFSLSLSWMFFVDRQLDDILIKERDEYGTDLSEVDFAVAEDELHTRNIERVLYGMKRIEELGVTITLCNFGSNFSAIKNIHHTPLTTLILDKEWLRSCLQEPEGRKVVRAMLRLSKDLHMRSISMGIEEKDRDFLINCRCDANGSVCREDYMDPADYGEWMKGRLPGERVIRYPFRGSLLDDRGGQEGHFVGDGVTYAGGITDSWGGICFPGGGVGDNVVVLPESVFVSNSFTISFWIRPGDEVNWASVFYRRTQEGYLSVVPYCQQTMGLSVFRNAPDNEKCHDACYRQILRDRWSYLCFAYDAVTETLRCFIDGKKVSSETDMPIQIGCRQVILGGDPYQPSFTGRVSALCIYDYALSDREAEESWKAFLSEPGFAGEK